LLVEVVCGGQNCRVVRRPLPSTGAVMAKNSKRREWTKDDVRELKTLARQKTPAAKIAKSLKRNPWRNASESVLAERVVGHAGIGARARCRLITYLDSGAHPCTPPAIPYRPAVGPIARRRRNVDRFRDHISGGRCVITGLRNCRAE
jgi:hypothetical protein